MRFSRFIATFLFTLTPTTIKHFIRDRLPEHTVREVRRLINPNSLSRYHQRNKARQFEDKLWSGFSTTALTDLQLLRDDEERPWSLRVHAAWALARWYMCQGDYQSALHNVQLVREWRTWKDVDIAQSLLEADCYTQLGESDNARKTLQHALELRPGNPQLLLALANTHLSDHQARLDIVNPLFTKYDILPIALRDERLPLTIENLQVQPTSEGLDDKDLHSQPLVSVIMPVYQAAKTLHIAVDSLLKQTWHNLEIIIVDDCSPDSTFEVAKQYELAEPRVRAFRQETNQGAYAARNLGLTHANGEFVTTHDADDWSHPQKIEVQVNDLLEKRDGRRANVTHWIRVFPNLLFRGTPRPTNHMIQWNHSSLMLRRDFLESLGGWDHVRIAGDTELIWRIEKITGNHVARLLPEVPLSFALEEPDSLTRESKSHVWTIQYGVRREYREMIRFWHEHAENSALLPGKECVVKSCSLFPLPSFVKADKENEVALDVLLVMDASKLDEIYDDAIKELYSTLENYDRVGLFHWPHYHANTMAPVNKAIRELVYQGKLTKVVSGEHVVAKQVWVLNPFSVQYPIDRAPEVKCETCKVFLYGHSLQNLRDADETVKSNIEDNLVKFFGSHTNWICAVDSKREEYTDHDFKDVLNKIIT